MSLCAICAKTSLDTASSAVHISEVLTEMLRSLGTNDLAKIQQLVQLSVPYLSLLPLNPANTEH